MPADLPRFSLEIERYLAGVLSPERARALEENLGPETLRALREAHQRESETLFEELPPGHFARLVAARARVAQPDAAKKRTALWLVPALSALLVVAVAGPMLQSTPKGAVERETTREKGLAPEILVFRQGEAGVEQLSPLAHVSARDVLQLGYVAAGRPYGVILSFDGAGQVTLHGPARTGEPRLLTQGKHMLETAYELDAAPHFERFVLVTSRRPFDVQAVLDAASQVAQGKAGAEAKLSLSADFEQVSFVVRKAAP